MSVNGEVLSLIARKAGLAGMSTSVYVRQAALGAKLSAKVNDRVYAALGRIGGNLNQLVRIANRTRRLPMERYLRDAVEEVRVRSERIEHLEHHLDTLPEDQALLQRTAERASDLSPDRTARLTRALGREASFDLRREIGRLLERDRGLER